MVVVRDGLRTRKFPGMARLIQIHTSQKAGQLLEERTLRVSWGYLLVSSFMRQVGSY